MLRWSGILIRSICGWSSREYAIRWLRMLRSLKREMRRYWRRRRLRCWYLSIRISWTRRTSIKITGLETRIINLSSESMLVGTQRMVFDEWCWLLWLERCLGWGFIVGSLIQWLRIEESWLLSLKERSRFLISLWIRRSLFSCIFTFQIIDLALNFRMVLKTRRNFILIK